MINATFDVCKERALPARRDSANCQPTSICRSCSGTESAPCRGRGSVWSFLLLATLFSASGASCPQFVRTYGPPLPRVLPPNPALSDVINAVNGNSARVQSLATEDASISVPFMPSLRARLYLERPRHFRLLGDLAITGSKEVDLGSNDELFWFWAKRNPQPAIFFCRHDQFEQSLARNLLPVEPQWLIEALGVVTLDPAANYEGPTLVGPRRLRLSTWVQTGQGRMLKITDVDESQGWVVAQYLYNERQQPVASAAASNHGRDPVTGVVLPARIQIDTPATDASSQLSLRIDLRNVRVNQPGRSAQLWAMPNYPGYPPLNLADPALRMVDPTVAPARAVPPARTPTP